METSFSFDDFFLPAGAASFGSPDEGRGEGNVDGGRGGGGGGGGSKTGAGVRGGMFGSMGAPTSFSSPSADDLLWLRKEGGSVEGAEARVCPLCRKCFVSRYYYERHMKCHQVQKEQCPFCPFRSTYKWNLKSHIRNKHKELEEPTPPPSQQPPPPTSL